MAKFQDNNLKDRVLQTSGIASSFEVNNITGKIFLHLKDLVPLIADRKEVQSLKDRYLAPVVVSWWTYNYVYMLLKYVSIIILFLRFANNIITVWNSLG